MLNEFRWTDEAVEALKIGVGYGLSARAISVLLGCSRNAVIGKARCIGVRLTGVSRSSGAGLAGGREVIPASETIAAQVQAAVAGGLKAADVDLPPPAPPKPRPPKPEPVPAPMTFFDTLPAADWPTPTERRCRAVLGEPADMIYCDEPTLGLKSWCAAHHALYCAPKSERVERRVGRWL